MHRLILAAFACLMTAVPALAADSQDDPDMAVVVDTVLVTGTWAPLSPRQQPQTLTVVDGARLRERGATDLRSALALVAGVEAVPGGDAGPAGSVPALWGLREFDAFLLVVDGIPWGGAFIPSLTTFDMNDVDRIEVLRGPAPVTYGSTSFVGVIHVIHHAPGAGDNHAMGVAGSHETFRGMASADIGSISRLSVDASTDGYPDDEAGVDRVHGRYRVHLPKGIHFDADAVFLQQGPESPVPRKGSELDPAIPIDSNQNPTDSKLDTTRLQFSAMQASRWVDWTFAYSRADDDNIRGFLEPDATDDGSTPNANGYTQDRELSEIFGGAHHRFVPESRIGLTVGFDALFGEGKQNSNNFRYYAPFTGGPVQSSSQGVPVEMTEFEAERTFFGLFTEADWHPSPAWTVVAGIRLNSVEEKREGEVEEEGMEVPAEVEEDETRPGGSVGVTWTAWKSGSDDFAVYANARDTFKPAAIDFGPEAEVDPLDSETARSAELGMRTALMGSKLHVDASLFRMDFENLVVATIIDGRPGLANAGEERFDGFETDAEYSFTPAWNAMVTYAWHEATFTDYEQTFDGVLTSLDGKRLEMSPKHLASAGLAYSGPKFFGEVFTNMIGERFLNKRNTAIAEAYTTIDASAGAHLGRVDVRVTGKNLSDRRDPVAESELGDAQYYRLAALKVEAAVGVGF